MALGPVESKLIRQCGLSPEQARKLVRKEKKRLSIPKETAWTAELEEECLKQVDDSAGMRPTRTSIRNEAKRQKGEGEFLSHHQRKQRAVMSAAPQDNIERLEEARQRRLVKARERIAREKTESERQEKERRIKARQQMDQIPSTADMPLEVRRVLVYQWWARTAMQPRENFRRRVAAMPPSAGIAANDVDLLPWNARGNLVDSHMMADYMRQCAKK